MSVLYDCEMADSTLHSFGRTLSALSTLLILTADASRAAEPDLDAIESDRPEYGLVKGPDGYYFTRKDGDWGSVSASKILRFVSPDSDPDVPFFANAEADESDFYYLAHRQLGCFSSDRDTGDNDRDTNIWCMPWTGTEWRDAYPLPAPVNSDAMEFSPVIRRNGDIYFASDREGGFGLGDLYRAREKGGAWTVENLGSALNSAGGEWNLELSPDGELLIFEASHRDSNRSVSGDLYASRLSGNDWLPAVPLSRLNTSGSDLMPRFIDDQTIVYASSKGSNVNHIIATLADTAFTVPVVAAVSRAAGEVVLLDPATLETRGRIAVGRGPHDIASSEDGRMAVTPLYGVYPAPHDDVIEPAELEWLSEESEGIATLDLLTGRRLGVMTMDGCLRPHGVATSAQAPAVWITCESEGDIRELNLATGIVTRTFNVNAGVHKVMHLSKVRMLAASNPNTGEVHLIGLNRGNVSTIATGQGAEALAASADHESVYVANSMDRTVCRIDVPAERLEWCRPLEGILSHRARRR